MELLKLSILVLLLGVVTKSHAFSVQQRNTSDFVYLGSGSFKKGNGANEFNDNDYFVSNSAAPWTQAKVNCKAQLNGNLVALESDDEMKFTNELIMNGNSAGGIYWTDGLYDGSQNEGIWKWSSTGIRFPPFAPWGNGGPPPNPNALMRVALSIKSPKDFVWEARTNSQSQMYICEAPRVDIPIPCYLTNDLVVVLDSSGSIGADKFEVAKDFVARLASAFTVHSASRMSVVVYSSGATVEFPLNNLLTPAQIEAAILNIGYTGSSTPTDLAIRTAVNQFSINPRDVPLNMVVLTDGNSDNPLATVQAAQQAKSCGVRSFSVGVTPSVNQQELLDIADGRQDRVFTLETFNELIHILTPLSRSVCSTN